MGSNTCVWLIDFDPKIVELCGLPAQFALYYAYTGCVNPGYAAMNDWGNAGDEHEPRWFKSQGEAAAAFLLWKKSGAIWLKYDDEKAIPVSCPPALHDWDDGDDHIDHNFKPPPPQTGRFPGEVVAN